MIKAEAAKIATNSNYFEVNAAAVAELERRLTRAAVGGGEATQKQ